MRGRGRGSGRGGRTRNSPEAAFRRFLATQKGGLQEWAKARSREVEEIGLSVEMEALVAVLLDDLREEAPSTLDATCMVHGGTEVLLLRACTELKFVRRHAEQVPNVWLPCPPTCLCAPTHRLQAVAIVLAREGGASLIQRPGLLSDALDWLCVNVPKDEMPLQFRPKLRVHAVRPRRPAGTVPDSTTVSESERGSVSAVPLAIASQEVERALRVGEAQQVFEAQQARRSVES